MLPNVYQQPCDAGLGAAAVNKQQLNLARKQIRAANQAQKKQAVAARRQLKIAGKNVNIRSSSVGAANQLQNSLAPMLQQFKSVISDVTSATNELSAANMAARRMTPRPALRGIGAVAPRPSLTSRQSAAIARANAAIKRASSLGQQLRNSHGGIPATTVTARGATPTARAVRRLRGLGDDPYPVDDSTYIPTDVNVPYDPTYGSTPQYGYDPNNPTYYPPSYGVTDPTTGLPLTSGLTSPFGLDPTGLTAGFSPFSTQLPMMSGCKPGSTLPRCLIYQMAQDDRQQFQFVFTMLQQMYAQLLQIVQQLMAQLQSAQQQPYSPYGQTPYGQDPYAQPYGPYGQYGGQYPGPSGYPGSPYYAGGGDSSVIPPGFQDGGGLYDGGGVGVPGDISQVFPGPSPASQYAAPGGFGPAQPNIISSDSLPAGAEPGGDSYGGGDDAGNLIQNTQTVNSPMPTIQTQAQPVNAGPNQPQIIVIQQPAQAGQSPYADTLMPGGDVQVQPELEPPSNVESWALSEN